MRLALSPISTQSNSDRRKTALDKGRNLVLCFDGTANEFTDRNTSIVKLFTFLEKESPEQLCYYQTGVGTYIDSGFTNPISTWIGKVADQAVAWYLDAHVIGGYRFLQSTYNVGDRIYLFGFSRGAYTARALAGMLYTVGLLPRSMPEQVQFAYDIFKRGKASELSASYKRAFSRSVTIEFIGVFDTVSSVGALYPRVLPFSSDNHITRTFRHAISLDEHRAKFRSNPWHLTINPDTEDEDNRPQAGVIRTAMDHLRGHHHQLTDDERIALNEDRQELDHEEGLDKRPPTDVKEVWFSGCHCDIGGSNDKDSEPHSLANVPFKWMLKEIIAADTGLIFRRSALKRAHIDLDELVQAAECTKIEDAKHRRKFAGEEQTTLAGDQGISSSPTTLKVSTVDGGEADSVHDADDGVKAAEALKAAEHMSLYQRWKATSSVVRDAVCKITDELVVAPAWWILEFVPFINNSQDEHGHWKNTFRVNLFRARTIPRPPARTNPNSRYNPSNQGVSISDAPALFHISVKHRMESPECNTATWRSLWRKKNKPYKPRAWPTTGDPIFVE